MLLAACGSTTTDQATQADITFNTPPKTSTVTRTLNTGTPKPEPTLKATKAKPYTPPVSTTKPVPIENTKKTPQRPTYVPTTTLRSKTTNTISRTYTRPAPKPTRATPKPTRQPASSVRNGGMWDKIAGCESTNNWSINTGNGYYGGLQIGLPEWRNNGGLQFAPRPDLATRAQQITVANRMYAKRGLQPWSCAYAAKR